MKGKTANRLVIISALALLIGSNAVLAEKGETEKLYDFDEKVHYYQTKLDANNYHLEIQSDDYQHFKNQSVFLLRHADRLCRGNPFMLKVTDGVQEYDRFPTKPRAYQPPLTVLLQCETKPSKD
ncbi:MAG: hypothetical protein ACJAVX_003516 [Pseudoalteromonas rhizosphaerae]|jgi:hypothetical protein|uniref:Secreted protein n=1 Tax=Pseudoalteromonas neustonica TaxID=1840331 RepID=A0ABY3F8G3_9GAMM|nr:MULTISPECIES: hypothetical protein [Pseudoalteromonas]MBB1292777.1 hypothetical protein [Pseudoalteromonas sp. SR41-4]MBB1301909.1 hypothetical protein [Pseudoalteromonas sp. SR44-8]MBB1334162.1 hypothetical protein [Pseudoalteromonas sp. SR41-6]MBB1341935.1 hypothetical protein [Pseudoalteromonas sp. SR45-6]MBB1398905.1 hypothetical protein [Pseudoalteromonas sp. SG44-8]